MWTKKYMLETLRPVLTLIFVDDDFIFKCNYSLITLINYKSWNMKKKSSYILILKCIDRDYNCFTFFLLIKLTDVDDDKTTLVKLIHMNILYFLVTIDKWCWKRWHDIQIYKV